MADGTVTARSSLAARISSWCARDIGWWARIVHRLSGLALAVFLPIHFLVLGLALDGADRLDAFLDWRDHPALKPVEWGIAVALGLHMLGGLRVIIFEHRGEVKGEAFRIIAMIVLAVCFGLALAIAAALRETVG